MATVWCGTRLRLILAICEYVIVGACHLYVQTIRTTCKNDTNLFNKNSIRKWWRQNKNRPGRIFYHNLFQPHDTILNASFSNEDNFIDKNIFQSKFLKYHRVRTRYESNLFNSCWHCSIIWFNLMKKKSLRNYYQRQIHPNGISIMSKHVMQSAKRFNWNLISFQSRLS